MRISKGLRQKLQRLRKTKYLFNIFMSIILVCMFVVSLFSFMVYTQFLKDYREQTYQTLENKIMTIEGTISQRLIEMQTLTIKVNNNYGFTYHPYEIQANDRYDTVTQLQRFTESNKFYTAIGFYRRSEPKQIYTSLGQMSLDLFTKYIVSFDEPSLASGQGLFTADPFKVFTGTSQTIEDWGDKTYTFVYGLPYNSDNPQKYMLYFVNERELDIIARNAMNDNYTNLLVYNEKGDLVYSFGDKATIIAENISIENKDEKDQYPEEKIDGTNYVLKQMKSDYNGWTYVTVAQLEELYLTYYSKRNYFILFLLIATLLTFGVAIVFSFFSYSPVWKLVKKIKGSLNEPFGQNKAIKNEIDYIEHMVDKTIENRREIQEKLILSNILWGQYEDETMIRLALDDAGLYLYHKQFLVCVLHTAGVKMDRSYLSIFEYMLDDSNIICCPVELEYNELDALIINYNDKLVKADHLMDIIKEGMEKVSKTYGVSIVAGIGNSYGKRTGIYKSFKQARHSIMYIKSDRNKGNIVKYSDIVEHFNTEDIPIYRNDIIRDVKKLRPDTAIERFDNLVSQYEASKLSFEKFKYIYYIILDNLLKLLDDGGHDPGPEISEITAQLLSDDLPDIQNIREQMARLINHACECLKSTQVKNEDNQLIETIKNVIDKKLCENTLSLEVLADQCGVSPSYLGRYFKKQTGYSPMLYVDNKRMEYAKKLLIETDENVGDIVAKVGYIDTSNFIRKFKKLEGITPLSYRKKHTKLD